MATLAQAQPTTQPSRHYYKADAGLLSAKIEQPVKKDVEFEVLRLPENGGYKFRPAEPFRLEGIISYASGYQQVAGFRSPSGFVTLATSVVEGLNILDVITADRVVAQISTEHPPYEDGQVPSVTFLGTRFDNLQINGHKVEVTPCLDILGSKPADDKSYLEDEVVRWRISQQHMALPAWVRDRWSRTAIQDISQPEECATHCSLVGKLEGCEDISFGHVIVLPHFGKIFLAELKVTRKKTKIEDGPERREDGTYYTFHLDMIRAEMGSIAEGEIVVLPCDSNGQGSGGGSHGP